MTHQRIFKSAEGERLVKQRYEKYLDQWPVPCRRSHVPTREGPTFVVACGAENAPPLLLLHGSHGNAAVWFFDVPDWAAHFRVYAIDVIGEPGLSAPSRPPLDSDAYALWLDDVRRGLGLSCVAVVGESLGGWLALDYATRRPDVIQSLALLCPGGVGRTKNFLLKALPLLLLGSWGRRKVREMVFGRMPPDLPAEVQGFMEFLALIFEHFKPRMVQLPIFSDDALRRLRMPTMAIVGEKDVLLDSAETKERLERNIAHVEVQYLKDVGHLIPSRTRVIREFLLTASRGRADPA